MTGLFFAVDPIWWIGAIHLSSVGIALSAGFIIGLGLWYRDRPRGMVRAAKRARYIYHPIDTNMDAYAELTLMEIRKYLTYTYQPQHSWAHIPDRIAEYSADQELVSIIGQLERAEYSRQELTSDEKEQIQRELLMKIKT